MPPKAPRGTPFPTRGAVGAERVLTRCGLARHTALDERQQPWRWRAGDRATRLLFVSMKDAGLSSTCRIHLSFSPVLVVE